MDMTVTIGSHSFKVPIPSVSFRQNPTIAVDYSPSQQAAGVAADWAPQVYGDYYPTSVPIYAAIKLRADTIAQVPLRIMRDSPDGASEWIGQDHPRQQLLNRVNPWWTRGDLWRATETYLGLWGSAFWYLLRGANGEVQEIWPLRPDKMRILPHPTEYIKGFVYSGNQGKLEAFLPDEILWMRYFNPKDEYAGLSPIAPLRLSADMGAEALQFNRSSLANDTNPGVMFGFDRSLTPDMAEHFWALWEKRHKGPKKARRPALLPGGATPHNLGFSAKDIELIGMLRWSLEDVARTYNVPKGMLHDIERATYANYETMFKIFLLTCIEPQLTFYQEELAEKSGLFESAGERLRPEFDTRNVKMFQEAEKDKGERLTKLVQGGIITPNEARKDMGFDVFEGGAADDLKSGSAGGGGAPGGAALVDADGQPLALPAPRSTPSKMNGELANTAARAFFENVKSREGELQRLMRKTFKRQMDDILRRLGEFREAHYFKRDLAEVVMEQLAVILEGAEMLALTGVGARVGPDDPADTGGLNLFNPSEWNDEMEVEIRPRVEDSMVSSARRQNALFNLGIDFQVTNPLTQRWLDDRAAFIASRTNITTGEQILRQLRLANEAGESIPQIAERIRVVDRTIQVNRSFLIGRTENVIAGNEGHLQAYEQADIAEKQWWTSQDERVRGTDPDDRFNHVEAHEQIRDIRAEFLVSGELLRAPGQGGSAGNVINCRCNTLPVV